MAEQKETTTKGAEDMHLVVYTDGGCKPSRGRGGYGVHGYLYTPGKPKQGYGIPLVLTADGYKEKGPEAVGITVVNYIDISSGHEEDTTNNAMELMAIIDALTYGLSKPIKSIKIFTDSKYVEQGLTEWLENWIYYNWTKTDGTPVSNKDLWQKLLVLKGTYQENDIILDIQWVKGHDGNLGNEKADRLASRGVIMSQKQIPYESYVESPAKGYWSFKTNYNRMLSKNCWYFVTNTSPDISSDGRYIYHMGTHGPNNSLWGKTVSDVSYSVVFTKEPEPVLEKIRSYQDELASDGANHVMIGYLSTLFQPKHYTDLTDNGTLFLNKELRTMSLIDVDKVYITKEQKPAWLAYRGIEMLTSLQNSVETYLDQMKDGKGPLSITDITDSIYDISLDKKGKSVYSVKDDIDSSTKSITLTISFDTTLKGDAQGHIGECEVTALFDMDIPNRNTLSALKDRKPSIKMITWRNSDTSIRYASIVETEDGDTGIWSSVYSNLRPLLKKDLKKK